MEKFTKNRKEEFNKYILHEAKENLQKAMLDIELLNREIFTFSKKERERV
ncbi:MAG: hypothetical protein WC822_04255 [Candidatus Paceibacterota bacterium]|jgi:hypothetical protein